MSGEQRTAVRRAITSHPAWPAYRADNHNIGSHELTSAKCLEVAARFGIDVANVIERAESSKALERAWEQAATDDEANATDIKANEMIEKVEAPAPVNKTSVKADEALEALRSLIGGTIDEATVQRIVKREMELLVQGQPLHRIEVTRVNGETHTVEGYKHPMLARLLRWLSAEQANETFAPIWIAGPTGSGKTHAAEQCAKAMDIPFYFNGALGMSHEVLGFVDAAGNYHTTPFRQAFEHGGVYLFDEVDASDNSALLALNAALANGVAAFPDRAEPVARHKNFRCIGAANTFGQGATAEFIGRAKIDAAFLSRFPVKLFWTYDIALEQQICQNADWAKRVQGARARAQAAGVKIVIDPRHSMAGAAGIAAGFTPDEVAADTYLAGLTPEQIKIVEGR